MNTENNKIIAEFVKLNLFHNSKEAQIAYAKSNLVIDNDLYIMNEGKKNWHSTRDLKYHESWDWLMPVIDKIENTEISNGYYIDFDIFSNGVNVATTGGEQIFLSNSEENSFPTKIQSVYEGVMSAIKYIQQTIKEPQHGTK